MQWSWQQLGASLCALQGSPVPTWWILDFAMCFSLSRGKFFRPSTDLEEPKPSRQQVILSTVWLVSPVPLRAGFCELKVCVEKLRKSREVWKGVCVSLLPVVWVPPDLLAVVAAPPRAIAQCEGWSSITWC